MPLERHTHEDRRVVHVAGEVVSGVQRCRACHMVLLDVGAQAMDWLDDVVEPYPAGSMVLETYDTHAGEMVLSPAPEGEVAPICQPVKYRTTVEASLYVS